jgi:CDP-6-deoxy-D-xylo-4-hexulose-3-dehydrase
MDTITERTRAILLVYVAGNVSSLNETLFIAREHELMVFEDNCEGFGGSWDGCMLGSFGTFSAISTNAAHIISTGEGGVLFTDNAELEAIARSLRDWGRIDPRVHRDTKLPEEYCRYTYMHAGYNFRPLELQAAMGRVQLSRLPEFKARRKEHFDTLMTRLQRHADKLILPTISRYADPSWFTFPFVLRSPFRRADLCKVLDEEQIEWRPLLAGNIGRQPAFEDQVVMRTPLPCADTIFEAGLWVSTHPLLPQDATTRIADGIDRFFMQ